jgi:NAD kinase
MVIFNDIGSYDIIGWVCRMSELEGWLKLEGAATVAADGVAIGTPGGGTAI